MFAISAPPVTPVAVAHVSLGTTLGVVVADPGGGAWVRVVRRRGDAIGRATADGGFRTAAVEDPLSDEHAALGPDGQAWFSSGPFLTRADAADTITRTQLDDSPGDVIAGGPDGTLWGADETTVRRVAPDGSLTSAPLTRGRCVGEQSQLRDAKRASDGAVWIADSGCSQLIRIAPDGATRTVALALDEAPVALAPAAGGAMSFAEVGTPAIVGTVLPGGEVTEHTVPASHGPVTGIGSGPDGTAYLAFGTCELGHLLPSGALAFEPIPIPARQVVADGAGGFWLASAVRLAHSAPGLGAGAAACDATPPKIALSPALRRSLTVARLRRGVRITVREPSTIKAIPFYGTDDDGSSLLKVLPRGGTVTFRVPATRLRSFERDLAAGRRPRVSLFVDATDAEGNVRTVHREIRVRA